MDIPGKYISRFKKLGVGESMIIPWEFFPKKTEYNQGVTVFEGKHSAWQSTPKDTGIEIRRLR